LHGRDKLFAALNKQYYNFKNTDIKQNTNSAKMDKTLAYVARSVINNKKTEQVKEYNCLAYQILNCL
jgi:hypothetical protein